MTVVYLDWVSAILLSIYRNKLGKRLARIYWFPFYISILYLYIYLSVFCFYIYIFGILFECRRQNHRFHSIFLLFACLFMVFARSVQSFAYLFSFTRSFQAHTESSPFDYNIHNTYTYNKHNRAYWWFLKRFEGVKLCAFFVPTLVFALCVSKKDFFCFFFYFSMLWICNAVFFAVYDGVAVYFQHATCR